MAEVDYYQVLSVGPTATREEVRRSHRRLARHVHPDTNPGWEDDAEANRRMPCYATRPGAPSTICGGSAGWTR